MPVDRDGVSAATAGVDDAEAVALGIGEDHVVGIGRALFRVDLRRTEPGQPPTSPPWSSVVRSRWARGGNLGVRPHAITRHVGPMAMPRLDEAEFAEHGWHSDVERLSEDSLYGLVQFLWYAVVNVAASK